MHVKETAMHIDYFAMSHEHNVRLTGKIGFLKSVSVTQPVNNRTNYFFGLGVAISDSRHIEAALLRGRDINQS
jgi:hypothetical protein